MTTFVGFFLDDRGELFNWIHRALPRSVEGKIEAAQFPSMLGGFARTVLDGVSHFLAGGASFRALLQGMSR